MVLFFNECPKILKFFNDLYPSKNIPNLFVTNLAIYIFFLYYGMWKFYTKNKVGEKTNLANPFLKLASPSTKTANFRLGNRSVEKTSRKLISQSTSFPTRSVFSHIHLLADTFTSIRVRSTGAGESLFLCMATPLGHSTYYRVKRVVHILASARRSTMSQRFTNVSIIF